MGKWGKVFRLRNFIMREWNLSRSSGKSNFRILSGFSCQGIVNWENGERFFSATFHSFRNNEFLLQGPDSSMMTESAEGRTAGNAARIILWEGIAFVFFQRPASWRMRIEKSRLRQLSGLEAGTNQNLEFMDGRYNVDENSCLRNLRDDGLEERPLSSRKKSRLSLAVLREGETDMTFSPGFEYDLNHRTKRFRIREISWSSFLRIMSLTGLPDRRDSRSFLTRERVPFSGMSVG